MPVSPLKLLSRTFYSCLFTVMEVAVNVDVQPSSNICPKEISAPDWRWWKMCAIFDLVDSKGLMLSSSLWVA